MHGTEGIAGMIADELRACGNEVTTRAANEVTAIEGYDAVLVGGGLYANRWQRDAVRLVNREIESLRRVPVWFFSSGPLDDSADSGTVPPTRQVQALMERVGARGHVTFGGRLSTDVEGFPAKAMAADHAGDWRNEEQIRGWARELASGLATATPGVAIDPASYAWRRVIGHGLVGWAAAAVLMIASLSAVSAGTALVLHAIAAPIVFIAVSWHYFAPVSTRPPAAVALGFTGIAAGMDLVVIAGWIEHRLAMFTSLPGVWLSFGLIFVATYLTGVVMSMLPLPRASKNGVPSDKNGVPSDKNGVPSDKNGVPRGPMQATRAAVHSPKG
jgi:menaquinone-dependent protoporphyrinogen oxidase